jgi:hypothetical protein
VHNNHASRHNRHSRSRNKRREQWNKPAPTAQPARLAIVQPVALNRLQPGVVVWAHIPFAECDEEKTRPAVVVARNGRNIDLLPISTSPARFRWVRGSVEVTELEAAGLTRACGIQQRKVTIDSIEIINIIGQLAEPDHLAVFGASLLAAAS